MKRAILLNFFSLLLFSAFAKPGYLGVVVVDHKSPEQSGIMVKDLIENGAAQSYGIKENDIITSVNEIPVQEKEELVKLLTTYNYGEEVRIGVLRGGKAITEKVILGNKPEQVTVKVSKAEMADGVHWIFAEDKTEIVVKANTNTPVLVYIHEENGPVKVSKDFAAYQEKLGYIRNINKDRDECSCNCPITQYSFYKVAKDPDAMQARSSVSATLFPDKFNVTPNPSGGNIKIEIASNEKGTPSISIYNVNGDLVQTDLLQNFVGEYSKEYHLENMPKGAYVVQLKIGEKVTSKKIILQ